MNAKTTATEQPKATNDQKAATPATAPATPQTPMPASHSVAGPIKSTSTPISSTPTTDTTVNEEKSDASDSPAAKAEKKSKAPTKMEIASAVYTRMSRQKEVTRKQIVEQFVAEAKLSPAGASTYYQLIKAKLG